MKKILAVIIAGCIAFTAKAQKQFVVDANAEMRTLTGSFNRIKVSHAIDLYLSQSEDAGLAVSASEDKYKTGIKTELDNGVLNISFDGDKNWGGKNRHMKVYIAFKDLSSLEASGASDIYVAGTIDVKSLALTLSGASDFKGAIKAEALTLDLSGASDATISGTTSSLNVESSGASDLKAYDLATDVCNVDISGASDINITVNKELNVRASGASSVHYKGAATVKDFHSTGASSISKRD